MKYLTILTKNFIAIKKEYDYIIVGQGIAGTILHFNLLKKGKNVLCIDNNSEKSSSLVAAGMFNPIVFKRLTKSWNADLFSPALDSLFKEMEEFLNLKLKTEVDIVRIFSSIENQNDWEVKVDDPIYNKFLSSEETNELIDNNIESKFGYGIVKKAGWVNTVNLVKKYRNFLTSKNLIWNEKFDYSSLISTENNISYKEVSASKIIFCEGTQAMKNPYFSYLPFKPTKGEVLTIKVNNLDFSKIVNKGFFILPLGENLYRVGATYNWKDATYLTTKDGTEELINKIKTVLNHDFEIIDHQAGIRPTVKDRKPLIGIHPKHKNIAIFNGLGTKGILIAPYYANQFCEVLENSSILDKEVNIDRYSKFN